MGVSLLWLPATVPLRMYCIVLFYSANKVSSSSSSIEWSQHNNVNDVMCRKRCHLFFTLALQDFTLNYYRKVFM